MAKSPFDEERALADTDQGHTNSDELIQHAGSQTNSTSSTNLDHAATTSTNRGESTIDTDTDSDGDEDSPLMRKTGKLGQIVLESSIAKATWVDWSRSTGLHPQTWTRHTYIKGTLLLVLLTAIILAFAVIRVQDHIKEILRYVCCHHAERKLAKNQGAQRHARLSINTQTILTIEYTCMDDCMLLSINDDISLCMTATSMTINKSAQFCL